MTGSVAMTLRYMRGQLLLASLGAELDYEYAARRLGQLVREAVRAAVRREAKAAQPQPQPVPESPCPSCKRVFDAAHSHERPDARPMPGDWSVCIACAAILRFDDALRLRATTLRERSAMPDEVADYVRAVVHANAARRRSQ